MAKKASAKRSASTMASETWRKLLADLTALQSERPDLPQGKVSSLSPVEFQQLSSAWVQARAVAVAADTISTAGPSEVPVQVG